MNKRRMPDMPQERPIAPKNGTPWLLYVVIILLLLVVFVLAWLVLDQRQAPASGGGGADETAQLKERVQSLETELEETKVSQQHTERVGEELLQNDPRILLTADLYATYSANSPANLQADKEASVYASPLNNDPPNEFLPYQSEDFQIDLPYNVAWGDNLFRLPLMDKRDGGVAFGPIGVSEGGGWGRKYRLDVRPARTLSDIQAGLDPEFIAREPESITIGPYTIVRYTETGLCESPTYEVLGENSDIVLSAICGDATDSYELFDRLVQSLKR